MTWEKQGRLIAPEAVDWAESHVQLPLVSGPMEDQPSVYRVYFSARGPENRSRIGYADVDIETETVVNISPAPVFSLGELGAFDDSGVFPHWLVEQGGETYLYYTGWMEGKRVPYYASIGLAQMGDDGRFTRVSSAPVLKRSDADPYIMHSPCVRNEDGDWKMWYASATNWVDGDPPKPYYNFRYATSNDGQNWKTDGNTVLDFADDEEWALARPCIRPRDDGYEMWFCYSRKNVGYRIGYATSDDGIEWMRDDERVDLETSQNDWDSDMLAYPYVFDHRSETYMLYNGNGFGETGVGLAKRV